VKSICFVHPGSAHLPELDAYRRYFSRHYRVDIATKTDKLHNYDILWFFMGFFRYKAENSQFVVHEYSSLSLPPFARLKDWVKLNLEHSPNLRVFQNVAQSDVLRFEDAVPALYRDMGISERFLTADPQDKFYDVIYVGAMDKARQLEHALDKMLRLKPDLRLLMVGNPSSYLTQRYAGYSGVKFAGRIDYAEIPRLITTARFGLNYIPDSYPYNMQTSTKLLEYYALGLPVIGNLSDWTKSFLVKHPVRYMDLDQLTVWPEEYPYFIPGQTEILKQLLWHNVISNAGFERYLPD